MLLFSTSSLLFTFIVVECLEYYWSTKHHTCSMKSHVSMETMWFWNAKYAGVRHKHGVLKFDADRVNLVESIPTLRGHLKNSFDKVFVSCQ